MEQLLVAHGKGVSRNLSLESDKMSMSRNVPDTDRVAPAGENLAVTDRQRAHGCRVAFEGSQVRMRGRIPHANRLVKGTGEKLASSDGQGQDAGRVSLECRNAIMCRIPHADLACAGAT